MEQWKAWEKEAKTKESLLYATLKDMEKTSLLELYMKCSEHFPIFITYVFFQQATSPEVLNLADELIQEMIQKGLNTTNITEEQVNLAAEGGEIVLEKAGYFANQKDLIITVQLYLTILANYIPVLKKCGENDEPVVFLIDRCINLIHNTVLQIGKSHSKAEKRIVFEKISEEASKSIYAGWFDWRADLLQSCVCLCEDLHIREQLEKTIAGIIESMPGNIRYKKYVGSQLQLILYSIVQSFDSLEKTEEFVLANVQYDIFKQIALESSLKKKEYTKVLELADREVWLPFVFEAYKGLGDTKNQISIGEELVIRGETEFYPKLKNLFSEEDWLKEREILLDFMELQESLPETYLEILKTEKIYDRLLHSVEQQPELLIDSIDVLLEHNPQKVNELFLEELVRQSEITDFSKDQEADALMEKIEYFFSIFKENEEDFFHRLDQVESGKKTMKCWKLWKSIHGEES